MNTMIKKITAATTAACLVALILVSCSKTNDVGTSQNLSVYLTDDPIAFDAVNIQIVSVEAKIDTNRRTRHDDRHGDNDMDNDDRGHHDDFGTWTNLSVSPGIYNVLSLRNGIDTLLASGSVNGTIRKIRVTLGSSNTVVVNGITYPLVLQNDSNRYIYAHINNRHRHHSPDSSQVGVWVDFDLGRSIVYQNGQYILRPVVRPFCDRYFAQIKGKVLPHAARTIVKVFNATDSATAFPERDGNFKIRGLEPGVYTVVYDGIAPFIDTTITNVSVAAGVPVTLPTVTLRQ